MNWKRIVTLFFLGCTLVVRAPHALAAPLSFEPPALLNADDSLVSDQIVSDDNGMWLHVWESRQTLSGTTGNDLDIFYRVSTDGARTWSPAQALNSSATTDVGIDRSPVVQTDGLGNWVAVWESYDTLGGTLGPDADILVATTNDPLAGWSPATALDPSSAGDTSDEFDPRLDSDKAGVWVVSWSRDASAVVSRSVDAGATWSAPQAIAFPAAGRWLASNRNGSWAMMHTGSSNQLLVSVSNDDAQTWTAPLPGPGSASNGSLAARDDGKLLFAFNTSESHGLLGVGPDRDILGATSDDGGATWSAPFLVNPAAHLNTRVSDDSTDPHAFYDTSRSRWVVTWTELGTPFGPDGDIVQSSSSDAVTWSRPFVVNSYGGGDNKPVPENLDGSAGYVSDPSGVGLTWYWTGAHDAIYLAHADIECSPAPLPDCRTTAAPGKSRLIVANRLNAKDQLKWTWQGEETLLADFGAPNTTDDLQLCIYSDANSTPTLQFEKDMIAGATACTDGACWTTSSKGYRYSDKKLRYSSVQRADLRPGGPGKARIKFAAKGGALAPPELPMSGRIVTQLVNESTGECWDATYDQPAQNTADRYKARSQ